MRASLSTLPVVFVAIGDPDGTRTLIAIVALLAALGLVLVMVAIWLFKRSRPDPEVLAPLEVMSDRAWRKGDPVWQRRRLDEVRPVGAVPLRPSIAPPVVDASFDQGPAGSGFDDLHDDGNDADAADGEPGEQTSAAEHFDRSSSTPVSQERLGMNDFSDLIDGDIDADLLAVAMADLDAELQRNNVGTPTGTPPPDEPDENERG